MQEEIDSSYFIENQRVEEGEYSKSNDQNHCPNCRKYM